ncbi:MAG: efflux RND transporter permease subunit [Deltaproteobacteria bacterium]|nr:efflux RND transporter permease subunit [Deltaproteobacteria bacterium]
MKLVELAIRHPVSVASGVILILLFGTLALLAVPVQLIPDVDRPTITVRTTWQGASPVEVEREIIDRQEKELKSVEGLLKMTSQSTNAQGEVILEFEVGTDIDAALLRVNNALQQVPRYPPDADKPVLFSASQNAQPIAWMVILPQGPRAPPIEKLRTFVEEKVVPQIERVPGMAASNVYGGREEEMQVVVDPRKVAAHRLTMRQISTALVGDNTDVSAGGLDEGKRRYKVRTQSRFVEPADADAVVVAYEDGAPIAVHDLGATRLDYARRDAVVLHFGRPTMALNAIRETGTNVLEVMAGLKVALKRINRDLLASLDLRIQQVYDETTYIVQAIDLVRNNIYVGGALAILVLLVFLRSLPATFIVAAAIPISLVGTFIMMSAFGRNINVISLAGLAFASGMVVDNSIVVLENIYRRRQGGEAREEAAYRGTVQVWGAILASTLTTVAVFLPVIRIKEEAGQLFADIAIAISFAVLISLLVSITVIPTLAARLLGRKGVAGLAASPDASGAGDGEGAPAGGGPVPWLDRLLGPLIRFGSLVRRGVGGAVERLARRHILAGLVVVALTGASVGMAYFLAPKAEYLPTGNRNLVLGILLPPPGYNIDALEKVGRYVTSQWQDHWGPDFLVNKDVKAQPAIENFFFVGFEGQVFMGLIAWDDARVRELIPLMQGALAGIPGMIPIVQQTSLFARGVNQGRTIDLDITGPDLARLVGWGGRFFGQIRQILPGAQIQPIPSLDLSQPELRFLPDRIRAAAVGLGAQDIGFNLNVLVEGAKIDEIRRQGFNIDLKLMADQAAVARTQDLGPLQINSPLGKLVTLESVAPPRLVGGPTQVNHIERDRAITLRIYPPEHLPLAEAMDRLDSQVLQPLTASGEVSPPFGLRLAGTADDLTKTRLALQGNLILALAITYLLMAALFESFLYPLVILFSVPLAAAGGFAGLGLVSALVAYQPLDVLTMLGFVILIGIVVNNAILIVDQTLAGLRKEGLAIAPALRQAVEMRTRPIFMTALTSVMGMLPLILFPGAGSELYRGLGSVVAGGLLVSTVFTLFLVPALLSLVLYARRFLSGQLGREFRP